jgi:hypothetical protein
MKKVFGFLSLFLFLWICLGNFAYGKTQKAKSQNTDDATPPKHTETQTFSGLKLKGQLKKPDLSYIYKRTGLRSEQIVDIPENFDNEIIQGTGTF